MHSDDITDRGAALAFDCVSLLNFEPALFGDDGGGEGEEGEGEKGEEGLGTHCHLILSYPLLFVGCLQTAGGFGVDDKKAEIEPL